MRSTRVQLEQAVIEAARLWRASYVAVDTRQEMQTRAGLSVAVEVLDMHIAEITDAAGAFAAGSSTSENAAVLSRLTVGSVRRRIVDEIRSVGLGMLIGLTDDELERRLHKPHTTVSSARNWLCQAGWLTDSGHTRMTSSRREATVWKLTPAALERIASPEWVERSKP